MIRIELRNLRRAFFRGETAPLHVEIVNAGSSALAGAEAVLDAPGAAEVRTPLPDLAPGASASLRLVVNTCLLKAGEYAARCKVAV
ncbi:MAG TPA: hypothetical protein P5137_01610, partial [Candidatus Brocadiia bacterium]|nr:hypothetical protein [Candidatus Brocadiia bacterium]